MKTPRRERSSRFFITTLGCPKNLVDSEHLAGLLTETGWARARRPTAADVLIVNTCGFIGDAQRESVAALVSACALKDLGKVSQVVATGCLVQTEGAALSRQLPVDLLVGVNDWPHLSALLERTTGQGRRLHRSSNPIDQSARCRRTALRGRHVRYLKIAEGCDCGCGFCIIPRIRGPQRSVPARILARETAEMLRRGAKELILVAQDTTAYGQDLEDTGGLPALVEHLAGVVERAGVGERWLRLLYLNPTRVDTALVDAMASRPVLSYFDLALQHSSAKVLRSMRRPAPEAGWEPLIETIRIRVPTAVIRATILIGHPGETRSDFKHLLRFLQWADIDRVGVFAYDPQPGTPSAAKKAPPDQEIAARRADLDALLSEMASDRVPAMMGRQLLALVDGPAGDHGRVFARPWTDAPDIDWTYGLPVRARPGTFVETIVVGGTGGSLELEPVQA